MSQHTDIIRQIREAAAFEGTAGKYDDRYEQTMKSAGASMYAAFATALRAQSEYQGRQIDERAVQRIYQSPKPRPWWDVMLLEAGYRKDGTPKSRMGGAADLIQWHLDPVKAAKARGKHILTDATRRERLEKQGVKESRKARASQVAQPKSATIAEQAKGSAAGGLGGLRKSANGKGAPELTAEERAVSVEDLLGEVNRIGSAVRKVKADARLSVLEVLRVTAREIEGYVR